MPAPAVSPQNLISVLGVVYVHKKTGDGGDLYLTQFGLAHADLLEIENWYQTSWFMAQRVRLLGTSAVYRVPTKTVQGRSIDLVVKNCRVGEDVPVDTRTLREYIAAEFNSPWEEFGLVMEMREGKRGPREVRIRTQEPLAIYVPPETMQIWQSGRSIDKINRIQARHPGIAVDILRQYKLVYGWIRGRDVVEILQGVGFGDAELAPLVQPLTDRAILDMEQRGYAVADMKPAHVIIGERELRDLESEASDKHHVAERLRSLVETGTYSVIDYELLMRTPPHEEAVQSRRRHSYLDDQRNRFVATELPNHLKGCEVLGVPYVFGHAEATGGKLWVVGRNARLFDYFLPERWRKTHAWKLSENTDIFYTLTKDHVHVVWKTSRVGETPTTDPRDSRAEGIVDHGFNSPFEEFSIANELARHGVGTAYMRAIYMTGSPKIEDSTDLRRYQSHRGLLDPDGDPVLRQDHNYITVRGYFNGSDSWVARREPFRLCRPLDLDQALSLGLLDSSRYFGSMERVKRDAYDAGFDASLLRGNDFMVAALPDGGLLTTDSGLLDARISNLELIRRRGAA